MYNIFRWLLLIFCGTFFCLSAAAKTPNFLPVDQAFVLSSTITSPTAFTLEWAIAPNYHLYSDSIAVRVLSPSRAHLNTFTLPAGTQGSDNTRPGPYIEYYHQLKLPITLATGSTDGLELDITYQGCADQGLCYPPQHKIISLSEMSDDHLGELIESSNDVNKIDRLLQQQNPFLVFVSFFIFGLLLAFTPCVFPMLPILSGIIVSQGKNITSWRAFILSLIYVLSSAITYALLGIFAGIAGHHLQSTLQNEWILAFSGIFFIILAMSLFGLYEIRLPHKLQNKLTHLSHNKKRGSLIGIAIMGIFSTLIVSPCISAPLVGALTYIGESGSAVLGGSALFIMGLGMGVPLLIVGTSAGKLLPKAGRWMDGVKKLFGVLLIMIAIWLWSRILPAPIILALSGMLMIYSGIYFGALEKAARGLPRLWKALGICLSIYGLCLLVGAASGSKNISQPLDQLTLASLLKQQRQPIQEFEATFIPIKNLQELNQALSKNQATLLDFYADWCTSCHEMQKTIFNNPTIQQTLQRQHFQLLQVDLTVTTPENQAILQKYHVLAPPTLLFFNAQGTWLKNNSIVGAQTPQQFLKLLPQRSSNAG